MKKGTGATKPSEAPCVVAVAGASHSSPQTKHEVRDHKFLFVLVAALCCRDARAQTPKLEVGPSVTKASALLPSAEEDTSAAITSTRLADGRSLDIRLATGVVTVLTRAEILASGATDLMGVLKLVPSFTMARDVDDVIGIGIRGIWAQEGKCLFMLNGQTLNDPSYGIFALGERLPMENVERVEVISGPGSVMYGGLAALGVVNVVTIGTTSEEALHVTATVGSSSGASNPIGRIHMYGANRAGKRTDFSYSVNMTSGKRFSTAMLGDTLGGLIESERTDYQTLNGTITIARRNFTGQFHANDHELEVSNALYGVRMRNVGLQLEGIALERRATKITLRGGYQYVLPWHYTVDSTMTRLTLNTIDQRYRAAVVCSNGLGRAFNLTTSLDAYHDRSQYAFGGDSLVFRISGTRQLHVTNVAAITEGRYDGEHGHVVLGVRCEAHSIVGMNWAPRLAYIHQRGRWHGKLMVGRAFKTPTLQNMEVGPDTALISPEAIWTYEFETGLRLGKTALLQANVFHVQVDQPIVYVFDDQTLDNYINRQRAGSQGAELKLQWRKETFSLFLSCGTHRAVHNSGDLPESELVDLPATYQAMPNWTASASVLWHATSALTFGGAINARGAQSAYVPCGPDGANLALIRFPVTTEINGHISYRLPFLDGLRVGVACNNVADQRIWLASPYANGERPLPQPGRTWLFHIDHRLGL